MIPFIPEYNGIIKIQSKAPKQYLIQREDGKILNRVKCKWIDRIEEIAIRKNLIGEIGKY